MLSDTVVTPSGDFLVGSDADDNGGSNYGSVFLFDGTTGALKLTLTNPDPTN